MRRHERTSCEATTGRSAPRAGVLRRLARDRAGNTLAIVAASVAPMLALIGGAIDMGRSYLSESRLQQACDAGVLAARKKLGSQVVLDGEVPAEAAEVGNRFFDINFRDGAYGTKDLAFAMTLEDDYAVSGVATVNVPTSVMRIFGNDVVALKVSCAAQLNFSNTDVMMVLDTTGSMNETNPGDSQSKIEALREVVHNFVVQLEGSKSAGTRMRYGFVPYSTNVNVGALLDDDWVVTNWHYQSRADHHSTTTPDTSTTTENWVWKSGTENAVVESTYTGAYHPAVWHPPLNESQSGWSEPAHYTCDQALPAGSATENYTELSSTSAPYAGPPAGAKVTRHMRRVLDGSSYWTDLSGSTCKVMRADWANWTHEYDEITVPVQNTSLTYRFDQIDRNVTNWRSEGNGCIEERSTYEIDDYDNVDLTRALDLDIDLAPNPTDPDTQWRPMYPDIIFERELNRNGSGSFKKAPSFSNDPWAYFMPSDRESYVACPAGARKLAEMTVGEVDGYLASLVAKGYTYHDIGMIWGGRLLSPTGIFAGENADIDGKATSRHLIFLTDGETNARDVAYSSYGVEPLDERRWNADHPEGGLDLTQVVEKRFGVACEEVKKKNITVWVIGFGVTMPQLMKDCAGDNLHWYQADNATQLNDVFSKIARAMGELRVSK